MPAWPWKALQQLANLDERRTSDLDTLVAPNWPFLQGTTIPVLDIVACAQQCTEEQQRTAKQVRTTLERLMELDRDHPARLKLERMYRISTFAQGRLPAFDKSSVPTADSPPLLPTELVVKILKLAIIEESADNAELSLFGRLRLVSKAFKQLVELCFQRTLSRYAARVVRDFLRVSRLRSVAEATRLALALVPLFEQVQDLAVWYTRDAEEELNLVLRHFDRLKNLTIYVTSGESYLSNVNLVPCGGLESLYIDVLRPGCGATDDVHVLRPVPVQLAPLLERNTSGTSANYDLKRLRIGPIRQPHLTLLASLGHVSANPLDSFDMSDCFLDRAAADGLLLFLSTGPVSMDFTRCQATDDAVRGLRLANKEDLRTLILRGNKIRNPSSLDLRSNVSLRSVDLAFNTLDSAAFSLDLNRHLRQLDLTACFRHCSSEAERGNRLGELAQQLNSNATLERLVLAENSITDFAVRNFTLGNNGGLKTLSLADNLLSSLGVSAVLAGNGMLEEVDLRGNQGIADQDARELSGDGARQIYI